MRISLRNQYSNFLSGVMDTQSRLMELNQQASSQKRINKPSDDPVGTARVLNYRSSIATIEQYASNVDTGKGWLGLADDSMMQASTILTELSGLAEQGATGTLTAKDRQATAYQVRQMFSQLVTLANSRYEGNSIFGGHKFEGDAFTEGLMVYDQDGNSLGRADGASDHSVLVQFLGDESDPAVEIGTADVSCRYSSDGGLSWTETTIGTDGELDAGGVSINLTGHTVSFSPDTNTKMSSGSWVTIAPTAIYQGDHETQTAITYDGGDTTIVGQALSGFSTETEILVTGTLGGTVSYQYREAGSSTWEPSTAIDVDTSTGNAVLDTPYGAVRLVGTPGTVNMTMTAHPDLVGVVNQGSEVNAVARGSFGSDVMVRIDNDPSVEIGGGTISYSYSTDGGVNWSSGHTASNTADPAELLVPGGKLELSARSGDTTIPLNTQFVIHPQTAGLDVEISEGQFVRLNNIGADIFGGYYSYGDQPVFADSDVGRNLFVAVGKLVAALENNDQAGCSEALDNLQTGQEFFMAELASVGARENRLDVAETVLSGLKLNETERMSNVEDVDLATLMTELANQQLTYETVLKSSSMIMKMSLVNYI